MRAAASEAVKATTAAVEQKQAAERALQQQRDTADALARELTSLRANFDAAGRATTEDSADLGGRDDRAEAGI